LYDLNKALYWACQADNDDSMIAAAMLLSEETCDINRHFLDVGESSSEYDHMITKPLNIAIDMMNHDCVELLLAHPNMKVSNTS